MSFEACVAGDVVFAVLSLGEAGADCAAGFATAAVTGSAAGDDTVADSTLAVILGEPAELGVVPVAAAPAGAGATFALASMEAAVWLTTGAAAGVSLLAVAELAG